MDRDTAFIFYTALVSVVGQELRRFGVIRLPHLGDLALVPQKPRVAWMGRQQVRIGEREVLRFYPKRRLKRHLYDRRKNK